MKVFFKLRQEIADHIKKSKFIFVFIFLSIIIGLVCGTIAVFSDVNLNSVLSFSDKNIFAYINGSASCLNIFISKLLEAVLGFLLIYLFCLSAISSLLCFLFMAYQSFLLVLTAQSLISLYGFSGWLNVVLIFVPINAILFVVFSLAISVGIIRAKEAKKYREAFRVSFKLNNFYVKYLLCFLMMLVLVVVYSFLLPILLKSFLLYLY